MNKHKIPIGNLFGGFNNKQTYILILTIISLVVLYKINIIIMSVIASILIVYLISIYHKKHILTSKDKGLNTDISWHTLTEDELLFLKVYYKAKLQIYIKNFVSTFILLSIVYIVLYIDNSRLLKDISIVFIIYIVISLASMIYLLICQKIDISAECSYIPIREKYSVDFNLKGSSTINNYAIIVLNYKKYIYKIESIDYNKIMIVSYKGISSVIASNIYPE